MRPRKYVKGRVLTLGQAVAEMNAGRYVMLHDKPLHPGWGMSMQAQTLNGFCRRGMICAANINPEWKKKQK